MPQPRATDFPEYFGRYISRVEAGSLHEAMQKYASAIQSFYISLPESKADYAYAPGKWTLKEVLQHVVDTERILSYRLLRIARRDKTPLPSFDENLFAEHAGTAKRSFGSIKEEFLALRKATDLLIDSLDEEQLAGSGTASNLPVTANAVGFIIFGHLLHHQKITEERYL